MAPPRLRLMAPPALRLMVPPALRLMAPPALCRTLIAGAALLTACSRHESDGPAQPVPAPEYRASDCNGVTNEDVIKAVDSAPFHDSAPFQKVVTSDAGCFWQEDTVIGTFGVGMGISTWWYRGSDLGTERALEQKAGRELIELSINGNDGFKARDVNACSVYIAKSSDVIAWSIQTMNPADLPDLCSITERLAHLSQDRVN